MANAPPPDPTLIQVTLLQRRLWRCRELRAKTDQELKDLRRAYNEQSRNWVGTQDDLAELRVRRLRDQ